MTAARRQEFGKMFFCVLWLLFTVTFALWWFRFSMLNIATLAQLEPAKGEHWERLRRMVFWEGWTWIVLLALGGGALIGLVLREGSRVKRIKEFFASFSHEVKTSLASLRVQAEALKDESAHLHSPILERLIADTVRLQLQLENSLFMASQDNLQLFPEKVNLQELLDRMREQWPGLKIEMQGACVVRGDVRALRTIFSNLMQNAIVHGGARSIVVKAEASGDQLAITVADDGKGFSGGAKKNLGRLFYRPTASSGSGLGLYICSLLMHNMHGQFEIIDSDKGFHVRMLLEGASA